MLSYWCFYDVATSHYIAMMVGLVSNDLEKISKVAAVDYSRYEPSIPLEGVRKTWQIWKSSLYPGQYSNKAPPKIQVRALLLHKPAWFHTNAVIPLSFHFCKSFHFIHFSVMVSSLSGMSHGSGSFIRYIWTTTGWLGMWSFPKQCKVSPSLCILFQCWVKLQIQDQDRLYMNEMH